MWTIATAANTDSIRRVKNEKAIAAIVEKFSARIA